MFTGLLSIIAIILAESLWLLTVSLMNILGYWQFSYFSKTEHLGFYAIGAGIGLLLTLICYGIMKTPIGFAWVRFMVGARKLTQSEKEILAPLLESTVAQIHNNTKFKAKKFNLYAIDSNHINASSSGARDISIHTALIHCGNPEVIQSIIAHEIGHIYHRHTLSRGIHVLLLHLVATLALLLASITVCVNFIRYRIPFAGLILLPLALLLLLILFLGKSLRDITTFLIGMMGRRQEYSADQFAVQAGFGATLRHFLTEQSYAGKEYKTMKDRILSSHPSPGRRILRIEKALLKRQHKNNDYSPPKMSDLQALSSGFL